jgi:hypothetical protein
MGCSHKLQVLPEGRRGAMMQYRYSCLACGKYLKIHSGVIVARTEKEVRAYFEKEAARAKT